MTVRLALLLLPACAVALPAHAQEGAPAERTGVKPAELFQIAERSVAANRPQDAEAIYTALARDPDANVRAEARFRLGMLLSTLGRNREAAVQFRALLDEKPDATRVRLELARVLALLGEDAAARRELRQIQTGALPPEVAQIVDQFAGALRSHKPLGASLEVALQPDSNINRATDAQTLDTIIAPLELSQDAREQSGIGVRIAGQAWFRQRLTGRINLVPRISAQGNFYRHGQFNDLSAAALAGLEWSPGRERFQLSAGATSRWYGGAPYANTATASLDWQHPLNDRTQLTTTLTAASTNYRQNELQDGTLLNAELGIERALTQRSGAALTLSLTRQTAQDPGYANTAAGASLLYYRQFGRTSSFATFTIRRLEADERLSLFAERRRDLLIGVSAGATLRRLQIRGFAPVVRITYERNFSTVGIYDYQRVATTFGITRAF